MTETFRIAAYAAHVLNFCHLKLFRASDLEFRIFDFLLRILLYFNLLPLRTSRGPGLVFL